MTGGMGTKGKTVLTSQSTTNDVTGMDNRQIEEKEEELHLPFNKQRTDRQFSPRGHPSPADRSRDGRK
jgi:hypothetical protein